MNDAISIRSALSNCQAPHLAVNQFGANGWLRRTNWLDLAVWVTKRFGKTFQLCKNGNWHNVNDLGSVCAEADPTPLVGYNVEKLFGKTWATCWGKRKTKTCSRRLKKPTQSHFEFQGRITT